ncbi:MAG: hypothetical protein V5A57_00265 [Candidatus Paceibacterota bacterium]
MDILIWALVISFFILLASIPFTIYLHRGILKSTQKEDPSSSLLAGYGGLLLVNIGIGIALVTSVLSVEPNYSGMFIGMGGFGQAMAAAQVIILLIITSLVEGITTMRFLRKHGETTSSEDIMLWVIIACLLAPLLFVLYVVVL